MDRAQTDLDATAVADPGATTVRPLDLLALGVLALAVRLPAFVASRALTFDDGVFANSAVAMREGGVPFRDVFSSQGPWFLPLVRVGDVLAAQTMNGPRVLAVASGVVAVLATYWCALAVTDRVGALLSGTLVAVSGGLVWVTGPLAADGPALAFAVVAMGLALRHRDRPTDGSALAIGAAIGATLSTKSLEAPVLVPVGLVLAAPVVSALRWRRLDAAGLRRGLLAVAASLVVFLVVAVPFGLDRVWDQSVTYRTDAADERDVPATAAKLVSTLWDRDLATLFLAAVCLGAGVVALRRTGSARVAGAPADDSWWSHRSWRREPPVAWRPSGRLLTVSWLVATLLWLAAVVSPLWRPHVAAVAIPLSLVVGVYRPPVRVLLVAAAIAAPMVVVQLDGLLVTGPYRGTQAELVAALEELPEGAWVLSDDPGVVWRAGRRTTDDLVDPSMLRLAQGRYTEDSLVRDASDPRICAVVASSPQHFRTLEGLPERLEALGFAAEPSVGDGTVLYVRTDCDPG
jgi:hypothetical protein